MFDLFGRKKKAKEKHEKELKNRLASKLRHYDSADDKSSTEFTEIDFGHGKKKVKKIALSNDPSVTANPSEIGKDRAGDGRKKDR